VSKCSLHVPSARATNLALAAPTSSSHTNLVTHRPWHWCERVQPDPRDRLEVGAQSREEEEDTSLM